MLLSVIIPVLNEARVLGQTLRQARRAGADEVIVVDGGSTDETCRIAGDAGCRLIRAHRGRALQMNAGAAAASGDVFLFLHADTQLPGTARQAIRSVLDSERVVGGQFDLRIDHPGWFYWMLAGAINLRSRITRVATGDQAIFVRREVFEQIGGFPPIPLMEDVALSRCLKLAGRMARVMTPVVTSARRWECCGRWRTVLRMWVLRLLYFLGVQPERLKRFYADTR